jgi:hypothetical protein
VCYAEIFVHLRVRVRRCAAASRVCGLIELKLCGQDGERAIIDGELAVLNEIKYGSRGTLAAKPTIGALFLPRRDPHVFELGADKMIRAWNAVPHILKHILRALIVASGLASLIALSTG